MDLGLALRIGGYSTYLNGFFNSICCYGLRSVETNTGSSLCELL